MQPRSIGVVAALVAAWRPRPTIALRRDEQHGVEAAEVVLERLVSRMIDEGDIVAGDRDVVVIRFSGRAGPFAYRTVEEVRSAGTTLTFQHLDGPFHRCRETLRVEPNGQGGTTITHQGHFAMRGGLIGWLVGITVVRPLFERHVADHLRELAAGGRSGRSSRATTRRGGLTSR